MERFAEPFGLWKDGTPAVILCAYPPVQVTAMRPDHGPHFLIAAETDAATGAQQVLLDGVEGFAVWQHATHGLAIENLAELHCVVLQRAIAYEVLDDYCIDHVADEMHGPWLVRIPDEFTGAIASLEQPQLSMLSGRWLDASEGLRFRAAPKEWLQVIIDQLAKLARRAKDGGKCLYFEAPSC